MGRKPRIEVCMSAEVAQIVGFLLVVVIAAFLLWQGQQLINVANVVAAAKQAVPLAMEVKEVAEMAVLAAEEYADKGKLNTSDEKLRFAIGVFKRWIPVSRQVSDEDMLVAIHSFIPVVNALKAQFAPKQTPEFADNTGRMG